MRASDHDQHRRRIADVAVRLIAREGLEAVTVRRIAAELGCSTTVVTHYFNDKHELLLWTYRILGEAGQEGRERDFSSETPDLLGYLMAMSATSETNRAYWRTYIAIWDHSLSDPELSAELNSWTQAVLQRVGEMIRISKPHCRETTTIARRLLAMVQGISIQILFDEASWTRDQVQAALAEEVEWLVQRRAE